MATQNLSNIASALPQLFDAELSKQWNRQARLLSLLGVKEGSGKNVAFDVLFSGAGAGNYSEGSDVDSAEFLTDEAQPAILPWGLCRSAFALSSLSIDAAKGSVGGSTEMQDQLRLHMGNAVSKLASHINKELFTQVGGTSKLTGLVTAVSASGSYAGLARSTYSELKANVLEVNTVDFDSKAFDTMDGYLFSACGESANLIVCGPSTYNSYKHLFSQTLRVQTDRMVFNSSPGDNEVFYKESPIVRDKDCPEGKFYFLNTSYLDVVYLMPTLSDDEHVLVLEHGNGDSQNKVSLPVRVTKLARTGQSQKFSLDIALQVRCKRPNAFGVITISE